MIRTLLFFFLSLSLLSSYAVTQKPPTQPAASAAKTQKPVTQQTASPKKPATKTPAEEKHVWNLQNVDIMQVIAEVSRETGKNFIISPKVKGNVTIISDEALSASEVYPVFLSTLQTLGFAAVPSGHLIKIVPLAEGNQISAHVQDGKANPSVGMMVKVVRLQYVTATQLVPILYPMVPSWAKVAAYAPSDAVIISGTADIINRISGIIQRVDTPEANGIEVLHLRYATAEDVAKDVEKLQQVSRLTSGDMGASVTADDRSNSIMISGNQGTRLRMKVMVAQLDTPSTEGTTNTQVIRLHYTKINSILPVLHGIANQSVGSSQVTTTAGTASIGGGSGGSSSGSSGSGGSGSGGSNLTLLPEIDNAQLNSGSGGGKDKIMIVGDIPNNAVVISAPPNLMRRLKRVIYALDVRPKQVLVQGVIAEVNVSKLHQLGIEWGTTEDKTIPSNGPPIPFLGDGGLGVGVLAYKNIASVIQALRTDNASNILSTPSVMTLDNHTANIQVGTDVPITEGTFTNTVGNSGQEQNFNYRSIGLVLNVIPQITDDDSINMKIVQANSSVSSTPATTSTGNANNNNPTFSNERMKTSVLVKNSQILVLGGLMSSQEEDEIKRVPILGDIPLIGRLFQHHQKQMVKKVLVIFLRPLIIDGPAQANKISRAKYNWYRHSAQMNRIGKMPLKNTSIPPALTPEALPLPFSDDNN